jgi:hypothetical protein
MQGGEDFRSKLAKCYGGHTRIYTYEARWFLHYELMMIDRESDLLSVIVFPNEELFVVAGFSLVSQALLSMLVLTSLRAVLSCR